jgi:hypothetical protein
MTFHIKKGEGSNENKVDHKSYFNIGVSIHAAGSLPTRFGTYYRT